MKLEINRPLVAMALSYFIALFFSFFCVSLALGILGIFWGVILFCALVGCVILCKVPRSTWFIWQMKKSISPERLKR